MAAPRRSPERRCGFGFRSSVPVGGNAALSSTPHGSRHEPRRIEIQLARSDRAVDHGMVAFDGGSQPIENPVELSGRQRGILDRSFHRAADISDPGIEFEVDHSRPPAMNAA